MVKTRFIDFYTQVATLYGVKIAYKDESKFMKFLSKLLFFNKKFMTNFVTTIGSTVYFPTMDFEPCLNDINVLAHELVHIRDRKSLKIPGLFEFLYLFPQILGILSILAVFNLWFLLCLLFLLPWPAYGRSTLEARAYAMSVYFDYLYSIYNAEFNIEYYSKLFVGPEYYYMSWSKNRVKNKIRKYFYDLPVKDLLFVQVRNWVGKGGNQ